ncbi:MULTISPECIES: CRISPR-associated protein Cas4 [Salinibaculum]|uniref:CRISPR-associated protein Cas4 n=1 Tax=Salinibaculum TaxID=2732368 RepID=UPI0030CC0FA7
MSALNQYLYCPRRWWYYEFFNPEDRSAVLVDGRTNHDSQSRTSTQFREQHFAAPDLCLHGAVDLLEQSEDEDHPTPVERKRGSSGRYYWNDEVQLAGYCLLLEHAVPEVITIESGYIYLYETDERHEITITDDHRCAVRETIAEIQALEPDNPPEVVDNPRKCEPCSVQHRCLPRTVETVSDDLSSAPQTGGDSHE